MIRDDDKELIKFLLRMEYSPSRIADALGFEKNSKEWRELLYHLNETRDDSAEAILEEMVQLSRELVIDPLKEIPDRYSHMIYIEPEVNWGIFNLTDHLVLGKIKREVKELADALARVGIIGCWHAYPYLITRCILPRGMTEHPKLQYMQGRNLLDKYIDVVVTERTQYINPGSLFLYSGRQEWVEWEQKLKKISRKKLDVLEDVESFKISDKFDEQPIQDEGAVDLIDAILSMDRNEYMRKKIQKAHRDGVWAPVLHLISNRFSQRVMVVISEYKEEYEKGLQALKLMLPVLNIIKGNGMISTGSGKRTYNDVVIFDFLVPTNNNEMLVEKLFFFLEKHVKQYSILVNVESFPVDYPEGYPSNPLEFFKKMDNGTWFAAKSMDKGKRLSIDEQWQLQVTQNGDS
ncbi:MAG: hypothetical protein ACFFCS_13940 [Candidatus Hodarchaeota archaeon]